MALSYQYLNVGPFEVTCVIARDPEGNAWLIDPGAEADEILRALDEEPTKLRRILLTHGHADHVSALDAILEHHPDVPVMLHPADAEWAFTSSNVLPPFYTMVQHRPARLEGCDEGDLLADGELSATVLHLPGHTPGSVGYLLADGTLFSGDTLFARSVGRTDLPGGNASRLVRSLRRIASLPPETEVIPGHGAATTIGIECRENPFLSLESKHD